MTLAATVLLVGCSSSGVEPAPGAASAPLSQPSATTDDATADPTRNGVAVSAVTITVGDRAIEAELNDSATSRDLIAQLPLSLTFRDYGGQEKLATLPAPLSMDGVPTGSAAQANDIGYYAPDNVLVLYYKPVGYFNGIVRLGTVGADDMEFLRSQADGFAADITAS